MRIALVLLAMLAVASSSLFLTAQEATPKKVEPKTTVPPGWQDGPVPVQPPLSGRRRGLTLRQAWSLGITPANIRKTHARLTAEGVISDESSEAEVVLAIGSSIKANNEKVFAEFQGATTLEAEAAALDSKWLAILEAIYNLLKLLGIL